MPVNEVGAVLTVLPAEATAAAERKKLRRVLGRLDTVLFLISAMVVIDTIGAIAIGGGQTFTWLIVLFVTFFSPSAALVVSITLVVLAYLLILPAFVALRRREPNLVRPFRVPGGRVVAWLAAGLATGWCALTAVCLLWPGLGTADPDAALPAGFAAQRGQFEFLILTPVAVLIAATTAYHLATRSRRGTYR